MTKTILTRATYMAAHGGKTREEHAELHRQYYAQFVGESTIATVVAAIGRKALLASTDRHLNDILLPKWGSLASFLPLAMSFKDAEDYPTMAGWVCVAKEAAHQWIERQAKRTFDRTIAELVIYDAGKSARAALWDNADSDADVDKAEAAEKAALDAVRLAFHADTKDVNSLDNCMRVDIDFMRRMASGS